MRLIPTGKQLEYLVCLARENHFSKAADLCNVTPSTLSSGIKDLEALLGIPLAERTKRSVQMTSLGLEIANRAQLILRDSQDIMDLAASNRNPLEGDLRLGVIPTVGPYLMPRVLSRLHNRYPKLKLYLREDQTDEVLELLRNGELDAAVVALPYDTEGFVTKHMFEDPFQLACIEGDEIAEAGMINQKDLDINRLLLLEEGHCLRGHALEACSLENRPKRKAFESTSLYTLVQMVSYGMGITLLPKLAIEDNIVQGTNIKLKKLAGNPSRKIGLAWRVSSPRGDEFKLLADELCPD
ncbi:MAG: hydrogen peroxide-inducible genes activator [Rhizobiaceae bacterium]